MASSGLDLSCLSNTQLHQWLNGYRWQHHRRHVPRALRRLTATLDNLLNIPAVSSPCKPPDRRAWLLALQGRHAQMRRILDVIRDHWQLPSIRKMPKRLLDGLILCLDQLMTDTLLMLQASQNEARRDPDQPPVQERPKGAPSQPDLSGAFRQGRQSGAWARLRYLAYLLYGQRCHCCGAHAHEERLTVDHILPRCHYPERSLDITNLQLLCRRCNVAKGDWDTTDWRPDEDRVAAYLLSQTLSKTSLGHLGQKVQEARQRAQHQAQGRQAVALETAIEPWSSSF